MPALLDVELLGVTAIYFSMSAVCYVELAALKSEGDAAFFEC